MRKPLGNRLGGGRRSFFSLLGFRRERERERQSIVTIKKFHNKEEEEEEEGWQSL